MWLPAGSCHKNENIDVEMEKLNLGAILSYCQGQCLYFSIPS